MLNSELSILADQRCLFYHHMRRYHAVYMLRKGVVLGCVRAGRNVPLGVSIRILAFSIGVQPLNNLQEKHFHMHKQLFGCPDKARGIIL